MGELEDQSGQTNIPQPAPTGEETQQVHHTALTENHEPTVSVSEVETHSNASIKKHSFMNKLKHLAGMRKYQIASAVIGLVIIAAFVDPIKFPILNLFAKGSASIVVVDSQTSSPVENAQVSVAGVTAKTDKKGVAHVSKIKFGNNNYTVSKVAYTSVTGKMKVNLGSNTVGPLKLKPTGLPVTIKATNKLSKTNLTKFKVSIEGSDVSAVANSNGVAVLSLPPQKLGKITIIAQADGFNNSSTPITLEAPYTTTSFSVELTPAGKDYFLTNRNGTVDVFSSDLDGSNQTVIIAGSGKEDEMTFLTVSSDRKSGVLITKRDGQIGPSGKVLEAVYAVNFSEKTIKRIDEGAPEFNFIGWVSDTKFLYTVNYLDFAKDDSFKIKSTNIDGSALNTLATYKNVYPVYLFDEEPTHAYFTVGDVDIENYGVNVINLSNNKSSRILAVNTYNFSQSKPYQVDMQDSEGKYHQLNLKTQQVSDTSTPSSQKYFSYSVSPTGQKFAWLENRDGKNSIIVGDNTGSNGANVTKTEQVESILGWVSDDYILYRYHTADETSDKIVDVSTGNILKITNAYGTSYSSYYGGR